MIYFVPATSGHGIPEVMECVLHKESKVPLKVILVKPLATAISMGTGIQSMTIVAI
jgi:CIC family chloride channel protein